MTSDAPILRLELPADYLHRNALNQKTLMAPFLEELKAALETLPLDVLYAFGFDFARVSDLTVGTLLAIEKDLKRREVLSFELRNVPGDEQKAIVKAVLKAVQTRLVGAAFDATGMGWTVAEDMGRLFGLREDPEGAGIVKAIHFTETWYRLEMPPLKAAFEDDVLAISADSDHLSDLRAVKTVRGVPRVPPFREGVKGKKRHGDYAIALALSFYASRRGENLMSNTARMGIPFIAAGQAQKEVTHAEGLVFLDALGSAEILDRDLTVPPGSPSDGQTWLVATGGTGDWAGQDGKIAYFADGAWTFFAPFTGLRAFIADEGTIAIYTSSGWKDYGAFLAEVSVLSQTPSGAESRMCTVEEELTGLSGASVDTSIVIPNRAVVWCVSTRTSTAITGATSYDCGLAGETSKFGGSLGIAEGSTNAGVIGPQAFYSDTAVRLTANGGSFTAGAVKVVLHYLLPVVPGV